MPLGSEYVKPAEFLHLAVVVLPFFIFSVEYSAEACLIGIGAGFFPRSEFRVAAEFDVGSAPGHVGCDGYRALSAGFSYDHSLTRMVLCVKHLMPYTALLKQVRYAFRFLNRNGTDKNRLALCVYSLNFIADRVVFKLFVKVNDIIIIKTHNRSVCRNNHNIKIIDAAELFRFGVGGTGHSRYLFIHTEEVLKGYCGEGTVSSGNLNMFLCLNCLVKTV